MNEKQDPEIPESADKNKESLEKKEHRHKETSDLSIIGMGASAGGLEALSRVLPGLPADSGFAYVIAQHMDPKKRTMLPSLLSRYSSMQVLEIENGMKVEGGKIYVTPPNSELTLKKDRFKIGKSKPGVGPKPSIDTFFESLSETRAERAIGIILSGTGSDGAQGIRAINAGGGISIVQDPSTAKYDGMPRAAMSTGHVDLIRGPEKIGVELASIRDSHEAIKDGEQPEPGPDNIERILNLVLDKTGIDLKGYKESTIQRRLSRRMALNKSTGMEKYLELLESSSEEVQAFFRDVIISVTGFFRDEKGFKALVGPLEDIMTSKTGGEKIRIWVPACATGEEAYSLAIMLAENFGDELNRYDIQIFGTDIDGEAIATARKGSYPQGSLKEVESDIIRSYFKEEGDFYRVVKRIREMIVFARQDIVNDPPFSGIDLISCRNLMIYFKPELQERTLRLFHYALNEDGVLFLGKSESVGHMTSLFETVNKKWKIYRRCDASYRPRFSFGPPVKSRHKPEIGPARRDKDFSLRDAANETIAEIFSPFALIVDDNMEVVHIRGNPDKYLKLAEGDVGLDLFDLLGPQLRNRVSALFRKARKQDGEATANKVWFVENDSKYLLDIHVKSVEGKGYPKGLTAIVFQEIDQLEGAATDEFSREDIESQRIQDLEQELAAAREHIQSTVEELETANEELQSLNEEMQSSNEELQSSNEELETANEELQATNEELITVNEELQVKSSELSDTNSDLENLLRYMGVPTIIVDEELRVTRFTRPAEKIFKIENHHTGDLLTTIPQKIDIPGLKERTAEVIRDVSSTEFGVREKDKFFKVHIHPYLLDDDRAGGAIISFTDLSHWYRHLDRLQSLIELIRQVLAEDTVSGLLKKVVDAAAKLTRAKRATTGHGYQGGEFTTGGMSNLEGPGRCPDAEVFHVDKGGVYMELIEEAKTIRYTQEELVSRPNWWGLPENHAKLNGLLGARLTGADGNADGIIMVSDKIEGEFTEEDETLLEHLAGVASLGIYHMLARTEAEEGWKILDAVMDSAPGGIMVTDAEGKVKAVSDWGAEKSGIKPENIEGFGPERQIEHLGMKKPGSPSPPDLDGNPVVRSLKGEVVENEEWMLNYPDGPLTALFNAGPIRNKQDEIIGAVVTWQDITRIKEYEKMLEERQQMYRIMGETVPYGLWSADVDGKCTYASPSFLKMTGMTLEEVQDYGWTRVMPEEDVEPMIEQWKKSLETGDDFEREHRFFDTKGNIRYVLAKGRAVRDKNGKILSWAGVNLDITDRKKDLDKLLETQERFRALFLGAGIGICQMDLEGNMIRVNPRGTEIWGFSEEELLQMSIENLVHPDDLEEARKFIENIESGDSESPPLQTRFIDCRGNIIWAHLSISLVKDVSGDPTYLIAAFHDITERVMMEKRLEEANEDLSQFVYAVSHDLKSPIRAISNYGRFLEEDLEGKLESEQQSYIEGLQDSTGHLRQLLDDLLALSRIGKREPKLEKYNLGDIVDKLRSTVELPEDAELTIPEEWPELVVEGTLLGQVLHNLVANGFKFNTSSNKTVVLKWRFTDKNRVEIDVKDNGIGIESKNVDKIDGLFTRLHTDEEYPGTGLGLAIVKKAVAKMDGELTVDSRPGRGSTFTINIPTAPVDEKE